ncbi:hypothetical protein BX265_4340 [Streptomyces sp. TLI_235]|nr:hypothetical protein [Streptomyces sp. TLI_235]PBC79536.1 hypothetical protein BX265_4340 [Streptomyces sp. TLI_235]
MSGSRSEQELVTGLAELAEAAAPPSGVDVYAAVRQGRSRVARRRTAVWGAAAAVLLVCSSVAAGVGGRSAAPVGPAGPGGGPGPTPAVTPRAGTAHGSASGGPVADGFAPLSAEAEFGWLPASVKAVRYSAGGNGLLVQASGDAAGGGMRFALRVYPLGETPQMELQPDGRTQTVRQDTAPVGGREAYWMVPGKGAAVAGAPTVLRWRTPDGRWAELLSSSVPQEQRETLPRQVAEKVTFGQRAVPLPVRLTGVPAAYAVIGGDLLRPLSGPGDWSLRLTVSVSPTQSFSTTVVPVGADWLPRTRAVPGAAGTTDPASCRERSGLMLCVQIGANGALDAVGGAAGWLSHVTVVGADPASWERGTV